MKKKNVIRKDAAFVGALRVLFVWGITMFVKLKLIYNLVLIFNVVFPKWLKYFSVSKCCFLLKKRSNFNIETDYIFIY